MQPSCAPGRRGGVSAGMLSFLEGKTRGVGWGTFLFFTSKALCEKCKGKGTELFAFVSYESRKASINQNALQYKSFF